MEDFLLSLLVELSPLSTSTKKLIQYSILQPNAQAKPVFSANKLWHQIPAFRAVFRRSLYSKPLHEFYIALLFNSVPQTSLYVYNLASFGLMAHICIFLCYTYY